ncbi:hypothetical protein B0J14DRAFT_616723 [Halenospora varia]|nr:hypothetical protein B0J14DRAFT_616723 [Halenospora varia]
MKRTFNILIVGAGLGVAVVEGASELAEIGAEIQIPPNSSRILKSWRLEEKKVVVPNNMILKRYAMDEVLERFGCRHWVFYRADYQKILYYTALAAGVQVLLGAPVESVDENGPSLILKTGQRSKGDLIVGADGIRSTVRHCCSAAEHCAYRATILGKALRSDPMLAPLLDDANASLWMGLDGHVVGYPIRNGELYNMVFCHPDKATVGKWNEPVDIEEMRMQYIDWEATLAYMPPLEKWLSHTGRVVLIGDAAHAMLPFMNQGAATSIEDAAVLAEYLSRAASEADIPAVLRAFQAIRKLRCEAISMAAQRNGTDMTMKEEMKGKPEKAAYDERARPWVLGYDTHAMEWDQALPDVQLLKVVFFRWTEF